jgi:hypothetical protein
LQREKVSGTVIAFLGAAVTTKTVPDTFSPTFSRFAGPHATGPAEPRALEPLLNKLRRLIAGIQSFGELIHFHPHSKSPTMITA